MQVDTGVLKQFLFLLSVLAVALAALTVYMLIRLKRSEKKKQEIESRFEELEKKVNPIRLESLESRLNPHLFKNILNSIQSHAYQTYFALDKLADVLDYILL